MTTFAHLFGYTIAHATEDGKYSLRIVFVLGVPVAGLALSTLTRQSRLPLLPAWFPPHQRPPLSPLPRLRPQHPKMAKLTRTLGQNVPPELVFQAQSQSRSPYRRLRRASADAGSTASLSPPRSPAFYASRTPSPAPSSSRAPSPAYYATAFSSSAERVGSRAPSPAFPHDDYPFPTRVTYDEREDEWVRVPSLPHSPTSTAPHPSTTTRSTRSERFLSRTFEFAEAPSGNWNNGGGRGGVGPGTSTTYRRESRQGWSGEWGGAAQGLGMNEVVNRLRGLTMKVELGQPTYWRNLLRQLLWSHMITFSSK
ncbi:hypothetical protein C8J57DRAFT_1536698 [Mycena rebaudengoi]|nr:hypothetical protein C8J57DRAFT_1536698 [Mycena rebaudengoi]